MNSSICSSASDLVFFPVRHHSPQAALLLLSFIEQVRPAAVLVEGPSDYNPYLDELLLDHQLPIAIYTYSEATAGERSSAFYPFCIYSPEYHAVTAGLKSGAHVEFIDLPWSVLSEHKTCLNRYSDSGLSASAYISNLCKNLELEDFADVWDKLVEIDAIEIDEYMNRCHHLCYHMRYFDGGSRESVRREEFMAAQIERVKQEHAGTILVVTGGMHSYALFLRTANASKTYAEPESSRFLEVCSPLGLQEIDGAGKASAETDDKFCQEGEGSEDASLAAVDGKTEDPGSESNTSVNGNHETARRGIALTPYSYERLDSLTGYESGMPSPGFYHEVFLNSLAFCKAKDREGFAPEVYRRLIEKTVGYLRKRKQPVSSADLIAVEIGARALASLRGHSRVWRKDIIDAVLSALVKDEICLKMEHPFLAAVHESLRGDAIGRLAKEAKQPGLVREIESLLNAKNLYPQKYEKVVHLHLGNTSDHELSMLLHKLKVLNLPGFAIQASPFDDLGNCEDDGEESWSIIWQVGFQAACIESAIYGNTLDEAVRNKLLERAADGTEANAQSAALLVLDACLVGFQHLADVFLEQLKLNISLDSELMRMGRALRYLLYLSKYDRLLVFKPEGEIDELFIHAFDRCLWLLDLYGWGVRAGDEGMAILALLLEIACKCSELVAPKREYFVELMHRLRGSASVPADLRGAACGVLWILDEVDPQSLIVDIVYFSEPQKLGDFMNGLITLAKESVKNRDDLLRKIDELVLSFSVDEFLRALPALKLAFSKFTPRERYYLARKILQLSGENTAELELSTPDDRAMAGERMMQLEDRVIGIMKKYGLESY